MALSKLEMQQMLREMNVKFDADDTIEELKQRLQQENHRLWLQSVPGNRTPNDKSDKVVVRKRKKESPRPDPITESPVDSPIPGSKKKPSPRSDDTHLRPPAPDYRQAPIEKPLPGKPWKAAADGTQPFNRRKNVFVSVLRRARKCCERCGHPSDDASGTTDLEAFHILPLSEGGEHSIKNVVALCPGCMQEIEAAPDRKLIKALKRKTRTKLYDSLQVTRKKKVGGRRGHPIRRR
jgi:5-methylcytosine-specific restriction endonuclease McrA